MLKLLDISKIYYMIQGLDSYNLLTEKVPEKVPWAIYRPLKTAEKVLERWKWTFHKGHPQNPQI